MSKTHGPTQPRACSSGKTLPSLPRVVAAFIPPAGVHVKRGNSVINKLSIHFRRELFLLFSHNMLSWFFLGFFFLNTNKTKSGRPQVPSLWQGGPKAVFEVGASVLLVLSLVLVALALPPQCSEGHEKNLPPSHPSQEPLLHQGGVGGRLVLHWDWKKGDFGNSREQNKICLPSFLLFTSMGTLRSWHSQQQGGCF